MSWPFESWQQIAIRRFNLQPSEFWAMPLRDWLALLDGVKPSGFNRQSLDDLIAQYPDKDRSMNPIDDAADALENFASGPGADAANALADVFEQAGERIAGSLERAAQSGNSPLIPSPNPCSAISRG